MTEAVAKALEALESIVSMLPSDVPERKATERIPLSYIYLRWEELRRALIAIASLRAADAGVPPPIDMVLHCPNCGKQHIDAPEWADDPHDIEHGQMRTWSNPPHRSHLCHGCDHIWRPADVPTNGVAAVKTKGSADSALGASPAAPEPQAAMEGQQATDEVRCPDCVGSEFPGWKRGVRCATCNGTATVASPAVAPSAQPVRMLTEDEVLSAIQSSASLQGRIKLTYESGPDDIDRPTNVATIFATAVHLDAILALPKCTHGLRQGTAEWDAFRLEHRGASEAAA